MASIIPIIIPAYEPDERLPELMAQLCGDGSLLTSDATVQTPIILVNDGSDERYASIFEACTQYPQVTLLEHAGNKGKGRALKTAFSYCLSTYGSETPSFDKGKSTLLGCITADSDGQHTIESIQSCQQALLAHPDHLILGVRDFSGDEIPDKSKFGNNLTRKVFKILYHTDISDTQTGLRGISAAYMRDLLDLDGERFEFETRMLIDTIKRGIPMTEVPIATIYDSKEDHVTHFRPIVDSIRIYRLFGFTFGQFLLASGSSSVVDLGLFQLFCILMGRFIPHIGYVAAATVLARILSAIYNYSINYHFVFRSKSKHTQSATKYFLLAAIQMTCSAALTTGLLYLTHANPELIVKVPVDVMLFFTSYKIQKAFVFKG